MTYRYGEYDQFPSTVNVRITGRDTQFWAGYYGSKFAQTRLRLVLRTDDNTMNTESAVVIEPRAEDELIPEPEASPYQDNLPIDEVPLVTMQTDSNMLDDDGTYGSDSD